MTAQTEKLSGRRKNVKVFTRILPSVDFSHDNIKVDPSNKIISVRCLQDFLKGVSSITQETQPCFWSFTTDGIFYNASQEEIYEAVMSDIVNKVLSGINVILVCYGQTGSGKSFTVSGLRNRYEHRGLVPRLLGELFDKKCKHEEDSVIKYKMSFVEVVRREMKDLLAEIPEKSTNSRARNRNVVKNALALNVQSEEEGMKLLFAGESRQCIYEGAPYAGANMGDNVLTIHVEKISLLASQASIVKAKIHVLDLAGIDTAGRITSLWKMPRDIGKANETKSVLQQLLSHLESSDSDKLAFPMIGYLGEAVSKESLVRLISHIRATDENLDVTLSTLRFAERVSGVRCKKVRLSTVTKHDLQIQTKAADVAWLRERVELAAMLENQTDWTQNNLPPYRLSQLHEMAHSYINNQVGDIQVKSVIENLIIMQDFQEVYSQIKQTKAGLEQKLATLAEEAELAREKAVLESKEKSVTSKLSKGSSSNTSSLGRHRGKKVSNKTLESAVDEASSMHIAVPQVGELKNWGITIGPGIISDFQGEATKASKRDMNIKNHLPTNFNRLTILNKKTSSYSLQEHFRCAQEFSSDSESESKHTPWTPLPLPESRDEAWAEFVASECGAHVAEIEAAIEQSRLDGEEAMKKHIQASVEMKEMCLALDHVLQELLNEQHGRHLKGQEEYDADGRIVVGEKEFTLFRQSKQQEAEIALKGAALLQALNELNVCITRLNDAKKTLEEKFQEFCAENFKSGPNEVLELRNKQLELLSQQDPITEQRSKHFHSLQQIHFNTNNCKLPALD